VRRLAAHSASREARRLWIPLLASRSARRLDRTLYSMLFPSKSSKECDGPAIQALWLVMPCHHHAKYNKGQNH
jgi:hypothetical protein